MSFSDDGQCEMGGHGSQTPDTIFGAQKDGCDVRWLSAACAIFGGHHEARVALAVWAA